MIVRGVSSYIGHFPSEFSTGDKEALKKLNQDKSEIVYVICYLIAFIAIACGGAVFQFKKLEEDEMKDNVMDNEDEAKCCGVFWDLWASLKKYDFK